MSATDLNDGLAPEWDELLGEGLVRPPADFQTSLMHYLQQEPVNVNALTSPTSSRTELLQAAAVLIGAIVAGWQTLAFIFGLWATSIAV